MILGGRCCGTAVTRARRPPQTGHPRTRRSQARAMRITLTHARGVTSCWRNRTSLSIAFEESPTHWRAPLALNSLMRQLQTFHHAGPCRLQIGMGRLPLSPARRRARTTQESTISPHPDNEMETQDPRRLFSDGMWLASNVIKPVMMIRRRRR